MHLYDCGVCTKSSHKQPHLVSAVHLLTRPSIQFQVSAKTLLEFQTFILKMYIPYGEKFSWDKIFVGFADLPQTAKILTAKFCDCRALCFVIVKLRKNFREIFASKNFSPYGIYHYHSSHNLYRMKTVYN